MKVASISVLEKLFLPSKIVLYKSYLLCFSTKLYSTSKYFWILLFLFPFPYTNSILFSNFISSNLSTTIEISLTESLSSEIEKTILNVSSISGKISFNFFCNFASNLSVAFFHTKEYLLASASILVPSINISLNSISSISYNFIIVEEKNQVY